jgi:hypothetical protein
MPTFDQIQNSRALGRPVKLFLFNGTGIPTFRFTDGETSITKNAQVYQPWPIKSSDLVFTGTLDKSDVTITLAMGSGFENEFIGGVPDGIINVTIFEGDLDPSILTADYSVIWRGRVVVPQFEDENNETILTCSPISSKLQNPGLRRHFQRHCPHVLFGTACGANKAAVTATATVTSIGNGIITIGTVQGSPGQYGGGLASWVASGRTITRTITKVQSNGTNVIVRGNTKGLTIGMTLTLVRGCNRTQAQCRDLHNNIVNFGGQPYIPLENPLSKKVKFY